MRITPNSVMTPKPPMPAEPTSFLKSVVLENPMLVEAKRFGRKFFGVSRFTALNTTFLVLGIIIYSILLLLTITFRSSLGAVVMIYLQTACFCFVVPSITYGAVAGEREKRTWDLLLVAPVTKTQIIVGKSLSSTLVILTVAAFLALPMMLSFNGREETIGRVLTQEMISLAFAFTLGCYGMFVSSRTNRVLTSQALIFGGLLVWLGMYPGLVTFFFANGPDRDGQFTASALLSVHPFVAIAEVGQPNGHTMFGNGSNENPAALLYSFIPQLLFYATVGFGFLMAAVRALGEGHEDKRLYAKMKGAKNAAR